MTWWMGVIALPVMPSAAVATGNCPPDTICDVTGCYTSSLPQGSHSGTGLRTSGSGSYDLLLLTVHGTCSAFNGDVSSGYASVVAQDDFVATGPSPGTPVSFQLSWHVQGSASSGGSFINAYGSAELDGPGIKAVVAGGATASKPTVLVDSTAVVPLTVTAGLPFRLAFHVGAGCVSGSSDWDGACTLLSLPPGVVVTSCQGYSIGTVTAARGVSWGRVHCMYR